MFDAHSTLGQRDECGLNWKKLFEKSFRLQQQQARMRGEIQGGDGDSLYAAKRTIFSGKAMRFVEDLEEARRDPRRRSQAPKDAETITERLKDSVVFRDLVGYCTGSLYEGEWSPVAMEGAGSYTLPHGVIYKGNMHDGMFHGEGELLYQNGTKIKGSWESGKLIKYKIIFADGMDDIDLKNYLIMPDRRFFKETIEGLRPAGRSLITNAEPPRPVPPGCYDCGDGIYDPKTFCVTDPDTQIITRIVSDMEHQWILHNCRKGTDSPVGFRPDLYECWYPPLPKDPASTDPTGVPVQTESMSLISSNSSDSYFSEMSYELKHHTDCVIPSGVEEKKHFIPYPAKCLIPPTSDRVYRASLERDTARETAESVTAVLLNEIPGVHHEFVRIKDPFLVFDH